MKIVVLNYTGNRGNWGCQATSRNLLDFLRSSLAGVPHLDVATIPLPRSHAVDELVAAAHGARIREIYAAKHPGIDDLRFLEAIIRELNRINYQGPLSVEWEDSGMDREYGAAEAAEFVC